MMTLLDRLRDLCDKHSDTLGNPFIREAIATISAAKSELVTLENATIERCAKVADGFPDTLESIGEPGSGKFRPRSKAASAIRALKKEG